MLPWVLAGVLARMLAGIRRRRRAIIVAIVSVVVTAVVGPPIAVPTVRLPMAVIIWRRRLPRYRRLHKWLTGSGHGHIGIAAPIIAAPRISVWIDLRCHKERAVILLLWRAGWHYRRNNVACLRIAVLGGKAPVGKSIAL